MNIGWPETILLTLILWGLFSSTKDGKDLAETFASVLSFFVVCALLYWGGFFA